MVLFMCTCDCDLRDLQLRTYGDPTRRCCVLLCAVQNDVEGGHANCDNSGETDLPCFVDKGRVESPVVLGAGEQPGRTRDELVGRGDIVVLQCLLDPAAGAEHLVLAAALLYPATSKHIGSGQRSEERRVGKRG